MRRWNVLIIVSLAIFVITIDTTMMNVAITALARDLHTEIQHIQMAIAIYSLVMAAGMITSAKLARIYGTKKIFITGVILYSIGTITAALSQNIIMLTIGWSVIEGIGAYPGVVQRWAEYAPWLECPEVLALRFEDIREQPLESAARIILRLVKIATEMLDGNEFGVEMDPEDVKRLAAQMVEATKTPSPTFRRGKAGGWREEFKPQHVEAFKASDPDRWLERLGYSWQ